MNKPRTRKITMTVFCLEEDAESVSQALFNEDPTEESFFFSSETALAKIKVEISEPTPAEDQAALEMLDDEAMDLLYPPEGEHHAAN